jgi:hypothetical protein
LITQSDANGTLYSKQVAREYVKALCHTPMKLDITDEWKSRDVFSCQTPEELLNYWNVYIGASNYEEVNAASFGCFSEGMNCYFKYLTSLTRQDELLEEINISQNDISNDNGESKEAFYTWDKIIASINCQYDDEMEYNEFDIPIYITATLHITEKDSRIDLSSTKIHLERLIGLFVHYDKEIGAYLSLFGTNEAMFSGITISSTKQLILCTPEPLSINEDVYVNYENTYCIKFKDCDDVAVAEFYDRLLRSISSICDWLASNELLSILQKLIKNMNQFFHSARLTHLLGSDYHSLRKQSIATLYDIAEANRWYVKSVDAKKICDLLAKRTKILIEPSPTIDLLIGDLPKREKIIMEKRCLFANKTLEELGVELGLTRERVRQLNLKAIKRIRTSKKKMNLVKSVIYTIMALCECEYCITDDELEKFCVSENVLAFLVEMLGCGMIIERVKRTDIILFSSIYMKHEWVEYIEKLSNSMPSLLLPEERIKIIEDVVGNLSDLGFIIPKSIVDKIVFRDYIASGKATVKKSLTLGDRYEIVLEKFFPDGIKVYQARDMELFRNGYKVLFDDDRIADNDHAVISRIISKCALIDRGTYILNKKFELPDGLLQQIADYINKYQFDMVLANAIMHRFNSELLNVGIENKYHLLGVLKQHFSTEYSFRRDYVVKGENTGNFYKNISDYVKTKTNGVNFYELKNYFMGVPDPVLYFALSCDENIIPMYNKMYIHKDNINFPEQQSMLVYLKDIITRERIVSDERIFHLIKRAYPDFIANNNIDSRWFLFSVLRSFFAEEFKFNRPHIIDSSFDSANGQEALKNSFWGKKQVDISAIKQYARERRIYIYDLSKLLDSYSDRYFILNKEQLISIDEIGYTRDEFNKVEDIVFEALGEMEYSEISRLNIVNILPKANISITEWVIYSIINRFGTRLTAITSSSQFMRSVPIVMRNSVDVDTIRDEFALLDASMQTIKIDDLSDIDKLIEDIVDLDILLGDE